MESRRDRQQENKMESKKGLRLGRLMVGSQDMRRKVNQ